MQEAPFHARAILNICATRRLVARGSAGPFCGMGDFKKLLVWQKAHTMALNAHRGPRVPLTGSHQPGGRSQKYALLSATLSGFSVKGPGQAFSSETKRV